MTRMMMTMDNDYDDDLCRAMEASRQESERRAREAEDEAIAKAIAQSDQEDLEAQEKQARHAELEAKALAQSALEFEVQEQQIRDEELASDLCVVEVMDIQEEDQTRQAQAVAVLEHAAALRQEESLYGAWDCGTCTFHNKPYAFSCAVCSAKAPPNRLAFCPVSPLRFGVELEIIVTQGKRDGYTCQQIAKELGKLGTVPVEYAGYSHETVDHWKIVTDASLRGTSRDDLCFELVSPVLQGEAGLDALRSLLENVRKLGITTNASCGFHVHVDASRGPMASLPGLQRVAQCFVALENAFDLIVSLDGQTQARHRRGNKHKYCLSNLLAFGEMSNQQRWQTIASTQSIAELVHLVNPNDDRYRKLNMTNLSKSNRPATCEFRQHGGVEELPEAEAWVRLLLQFCDNASNQTAASSRCLLSQGATAKDELMALFRLVDCEGLEQFFALERQLFVDHRLTTEWECKVCRRRFAHPRSLSQHAAAVGH